VLARMWQNRNPYILLVGMEISSTTIEVSMEIPQKAKDRTAYDPVILLLGIYPKKYKTVYNKDTCTLMFITELFTITKLWKQPRCPITDEWVKKICYRNTMEYYLTIRNNDMWFEGKWMQLEDIILSEVRQAEKHKTCMFSFTHRR
jgi:hypothetical protein